MSRRTERIAEQIRAEIARLLHEEVTDPRIGMITLTRVDVAPDLGSARVLWSVLETEQSPSVDAVERGLASAASFLRRRLAQALPLKRTPELRFRYDPSLALGDHTLATLGDLRDGPEG